MKQEPVAYWDGKHFASKDKSSLADIPLYTEPQYRELSDEELTQCLNESMDITGVWGQPMMGLNPVNFARAILKKASEK